jgi:hypothetical protein
MTDATAAAALAAALLIWNPQPPNPSNQLHLPVPATPSDQRIPRPTERYRQHLRRSLAAPTTPSPHDNPHRPAQPHAERRQPRQLHRHQLRSVPRYWEEHWGG